MEEQKKFHWNDYSWVKGVIIGVAYGLAARAIMELEPIGYTWGLMTFSFLFIVPFVVGLLTTYYNRNILKATHALRLLFSVLSIVFIIGISLMFGFEGLICLLMGLPIFLVMSLLGAFAGIKLFKRQNNQISISLALMLPFLLAPIENQLGLTDKIFTEHTQITIQAPETEVWKHITRVGLISEEENRVTLFQILGFPRPLEAHLDTIAVGGIRIARFDRGLFFTEKVTKLEPNKLLTFTIEADPRSIPPTALDEHVLVGDKYFDVLEGSYRIEKLAGNRIKLHLSSQFRLSTNFNFYAGLWSRLIMRDIQNNILQIVKSRSEKAVQKASL